MSSQLVFLFSGCARNPTAHPDKLKTMAQSKAQLMTTSSKILPGRISHVWSEILPAGADRMGVCDLPADAFRPADRPVPPWTACAPLPAKAVTEASWWSLSFQGGLPAVGGRYGFLRGAWIPGNASVSCRRSVAWGCYTPAGRENCLDGFAETHPSSAASRLLEGGPEDGQKELWS